PTGPPARLVVSRGVGMREESYYSPRKCEFARFIRHGKSRPTRAPVNAQEAPYWRQCCNKILEIRI
ncbi:MAG: hypothetical protein FWC61_03710, partial [Proteobacteria bacterium]|nr:hypothetical protein [Pseudomonadota bacterium]